MPQDTKPEENTTPAGTTAVAEPTEEIVDDTHDPDLDDPNSEAYGRAMGDLPPEEPAVPVAPEGVTVDEKGRWRNADGTFATKQPTKEAEAAVAAESAPVVPVAKDTEPPPVPWTPNIYGTETAIIEGALYKPGVGVLIPEAKLGEAQMLLARGTKYADVQAARQEAAKTRSQFAERDKFQGEKFVEVLNQTLLNPEWMTWAASSPENYQTAQMQARLMLEKAQVELTQMFGALPNPTDAPADAEPLDQYEGEASVDALLSDLAHAPEYQGLLGAADVAAIKAALRQHNVPLFFKHPKEGWVLDERPVRLAAQQRADLVKAGRKEVEKPKVQEVARRNEAAVPKLTETPAKPAAKPAKPKADADPYADHPWDNPKLDFHERRRLFNKAKGFAFAGE